MWSRRRSVLLVGAVICLLLAMAFALISDPNILKSAVVVALGAAVLTMAVVGKPRRSGVGLTEALLQRLPEPLWRAVITAMGLVIVAMGVSPWLR